jgi:AcrR family transcriptional regulator
MSKHRDNPRSSRAHAKVLESALRLFADRGIDQTSMDSIAQASGVSKATIYKHWRDKDALCLEAIRELVATDETMPAFDSGDLRTDLIAVLCYQPSKGQPRLRACIMPHLMAYASRSQTLGRAARQIIFEPPRAAIRKILQRAIDQGDLPKSLDRDLALALLVGPMMYGHLISRLGGSAPVNLPEHVVDAFLKAHAMVGRVSTRRAFRTRRRRVKTRPTK